MSTKDTVIGTAKQIFAEIVGDGRLAEEGTRQTGRDYGSPSGPATSDLPPQDLSKPSPSTAPRSELQHTDQNQFASLLGLAALKVWPDLPREAQERIFAAAADDSIIANALAQFLHDRHPRTAHAAGEDRDLGLELGLGASGTPGSHNNDLIKREQDFGNEGSL